jgi:hypothetical protein
MVSPRNVFTYTATSTLLESDEESNVESDPDLERGVDTVMLKWI